MSGKDRTMRPREVEAFRKLWEAGVLLDDIRRVIPILKKTTDRGIRMRAARQGMEFWRESETPPDHAQVDDNLMRKLLANKPMRV